jgi:hypothetical protein
MLRASARRASTCAFGGLTFVGADRDPPCQASRAPGSVCARGTWRTAVGGLSTWSLRAQQTVRVFVSVPKIVEFAVVGVIVTVLVLLLIRAGRGALRSARRSPAGVGAIGWALLFLTSGRMPPPPPASQIEVDMAGKKDRDASRDVGDT